MNSLLQQPVLGQLSVGDQNSPQGMNDRTVPCSPRQRGISRDDKGPVIDFPETKPSCEAIMRHYIFSAIFWAG